MSIKIYFKTQKQILLLISALLFSIAFTACSSGSDDGYTASDQIPNTGAPVITGVYATTDYNYASPLSQVEPGQTIVITGQNLNFLKGLKFNTVEADLSVTYTMSTRAVVTVPTAYAHERVNTIEYTTDKGTVSYPIIVMLPTMQVYSIDNEFAAPGQTLSISGDNFDYYGFGESGTPASIKIGGQEAKLTYTSPTTLRVSVPTGVGDNTAVVVSWVDVAGVTQNVSLPFRPTACLLFADLNKATRERTDQCVSIEQDADVTSTVSALGTPHLHFYGQLRAYAWVELSFAQPLPDLCNPAKADDYLFVFETLTAQGYPLAGSGYEFAWNWNWDNSYLWNPGDGKGWDTAGQWTTVRLPLTEIAPNGIGNVGEQMTLNIGFQPTGKYNADFRFGNFRIQKK